MKILVTGATGQLGQEIQRLAQHYPYQFVFTSSKDLDLLDMPRVSDFIRYEAFDWIINCAAFTAVDLAQQQPQKAYALNRDAVFNMIQAAEWTGAKFIHISTDYVFDGHKCRPYLETDPINPLSVYGQSKAEGETYVLKYFNGLVIRTSWLYSAFGHNFVKTMLKLAKQNQEIKVVFDQIGTPTYARDLAKAILYIIDTINNEQMQFSAGLYHFSNEGIASWYDFAKAIFEIKGIKIKLIPIETKDFPRPATRPCYSVLNKTKFKTTFNYNIPYWRDSLKEMLNILE